MAFVMHPNLHHAAVIYLRAISSHGSIQNTLVISKTKVAPFKRLTIPRLELCGAKLLAQLLVKRWRSHYLMFMLGVTVQLY